MHKLFTAAIALLVALLSTSAIAADVTIIKAGCVVRFTSPARSSRDAVIVIEDDEDNSGRRIRDSNPGGCRE